MYNFAKITADMPKQEAGWFKQIIVLNYVLMIAYIFVHF